MKDDPQLPKITPQMIANLRRQQAEAMAKRLSGPHPDFRIPSSQERKDFAKALRRQ